MAKGMDDVKFPYNSTEFNAMADTIRDHHNATHDQLVILAADLRRVLQKVKGAPWLFGVDMRIAAWRVTKPLIAAAGHNHEAAKAATRLWQLYNEHIRNQKPGNHAATFDVNA